MNDLRKLFNLRDDVVFLNHGSFGACPKPVFQAYQNWQLELERQPVEFIGRRFGQLMYEARAALAEFLGTQPDNLVYVTNATTGVNIVARSLPLQPGNEVLTTDQEYGAMDRTWRFICERRGARYVKQPISLPVLSKEEVVEEIWSGVSEQTRVLFLSHITANTALILPIHELIARARQNGIVTVIDGAHAPGQIPLDLEKLGADFYAGNCHKWLMAPKGSAFLYARPESQKLLQPLVVSWGDQSLGTSRFIQENEFQGTRDLAAFLSVPAAIRFTREHEWTNARKHCHKLAAAARRQFTRLTELPPLSPESSAWFAQMAAHPLPPCDAKAFHRRLYEKHGIEIPINDHNGTPYLRISVQGYNTEQDIESLVEALEKLLSGK